MFKTLSRSKRNFNCPVKNRKRAGVCNNGFYAVGVQEANNNRAIRNVLSIDIPQNLETHCYIYTCQSCRRACCAAGLYNFIAEGLNDTLFFIPSSLHAQVAITMAFDIAWTVTRRVIDLSDGIEKTMFYEIKIIVQTKQLHSRGLPFDIALWYRGIWKSKKRSNDKHPIFFFQRVMNFGTSQISTNSTRPAGNLYGK